MGRDISIIHIFLKYYGYEVTAYRTHEESCEDCHEKYAGKLPIRGSLKGFEARAQAIEKQLGNLDVILNSCIISATPYHVVRKLNGWMSEDDFAAKHILFQASSR